jgi:hypothetical protein
MRDGGREEGRKKGRVSCDVSEMNTNDPGKSAYFCAYIP